MLEITGIAIDKGKDVPILNFTTIHPDKSIELDFFDFIP